MPQPARFRRGDAALTAAEVSALATADPAGLAFHWRDPHDFVAQAVLAGETAQRAAADWLSEVRLHLVLARQLGAGCPWRRETSDDLPPLALALAALTLSDLPGALDLLATLEAGEPQPRPDPAALIAAHLAAHPGAHPGAEAAMPDDAGPALALAQEQIVQLHELLELYYRDAEILRAELARRDRGLIRRLARRMRRNRV